MADLENHKIVYLNAERTEIHTLLEGDKVRWADTYSIHESALYYTNSRIHEAGEDVSDLDFTIYKINLPD